MAYDKVQFIGYAVHTGPRDINVDFMPAGGGRNARTYHYREYVGMADSQQDIRTRCAIARNAILKALASAQCDQTDKCLKVFMLPEFFFRGPRGAYSMEGVQFAISQLRHITRDGRFQHWLFVFGTILGHSTCGSCNSSSEIYNVAFVQMAGGEEKDSRVVMKEFKSGIDFISGNFSTRHPGGGGGGGPVQVFNTIPVGVLNDSNAHHAPSMKRPGTGREKQRKNYDGGGIFEMAGVHIGLEVCLDHMAQRLRRSAPAPGEHMIQIQLVPSAGMEVKLNSVIAMTNGYVFNCDGSYPLNLAYDPPGAHTQVFRVNAMAKSVTDARLGPPKDTLGAVVMQPHVVPVGMPPHFNLCFAQTPGSVHLYPVMKLPSAQKEGVPRALQSSNQDDPFYRA